MKRSMKLFSVVLIVMALMVTAVSSSFAAPLAQPQTSSVDLSNGFAFDIYSGGEIIGTWTVDSEGAWVTTDASQTQISTGSLDMTTSERGVVTRVQISATQDADGGTAHLNLYFIGNSKDALVVGTMFFKDGDASGFRVLTGSVSAKGMRLNIGSEAPVMLLGPAA